ncbi:UNVERIFIED_CONTAM: hypothetical protein FKN15_059296 [Acipenser sinensis]
MNTRCPPKRVPSAARFFTHCELTVQPPQSYSVGGQRSSGQLTGKPAGARPDYRGRWCAKAILVLKKDSTNATELYDIMSDVRRQLTDRERDGFFGFQTVPSLDDLMKLDDLLKANSAAGMNDDLDTEYSVLRTAAPALIDDDSLTGPVDKWCAFFKKVECPTLLRMVQHVFSVPCSNAFIERVFSVMGNLWTIERNRLSIDTVKSEVCIRCNLDYSCLEFFLCHYPEQEVAGSG